jgi:hypothetical protein
MPHTLARLANGGFEIVIDRESELECYVNNKLAGSLGFMV